MKTKKRFMAFFLTLIMLVTALVPNGMVFAADTDSATMETDGFYYTLDYALSEDKTAEPVTLTLQAKEDVTIQEVILPDGGVVAYTEQPVTYTVTENGVGNFRVKYIRSEPAEPLETETNTEAIIEEATVTEPQTETSDLAVQEAVIPFAVTDIPQAESTEAESETEKKDDAQIFNAEARANATVTTLDELNAAIANATDGDTITVDGNITGVAVVNGKKITLTGGTLQALHISNGSEVTLQDITIDANKLGNNDKSLFGGYDTGGAAVILIESTLNLLNNSKITNANGTYASPDYFVSGQTYGFGGGVSSTRSIINMYDGAEISNNIEDSPSKIKGGGGIFLYESEFFMYGGLISNNISKGNEGLDGFGGGVYIRDSNMTMHDGNIINNTALTGGGIGIFWGNLTIHGGSISYNTARIGGGISNDGEAFVLGQPVSISIDGNTKIKNNNATNSFGGGIFTMYGVSLSGNVEIENNTAVRKGGGVYFEATSKVVNKIDLSGNVIINNNTVQGISNNLEIGKGVINNGTAPLSSYTISLSNGFSGKVGITKSNESPKYAWKSPVTVDVVLNKGGEPVLNMVQSKSGDSANFFSDNPQYITRIDKDGENNKIVLSYPKVFYHLRGGNFTDMEESLYTIGNEPIWQPSEPVYLDHAFVNWYSTADTSDSGTVFDFDNTPITKDTDIYARWYPDVYVISFDPNGGTGSMNDIEHNGGANVVDLPANSFTKAGHTFTGWNTAADGTGTPIADGAAGYVAGSKNITLYAQWKLDSYDVIFDSKGGSAVGNINDVPNGGTISAPAAPTNTGYTFDGWYKDEAYTDVWDFDSDTVLSDITLYAKWTPKEYTVKYDAGFDEFTIADKTGVHYFDADLVPTPLIKAGYNFGGWKYQDDYLTEATSYAQCVKDDTLMEITLVAQWVPIEYTVKYDTKGAGTIADKTGVLFDDKNLLPADPAKTGYDFTGWKLEDVEVTPDTTYGSLVDSDRVMEVTLTAQWELKNYTVKYDTQGADAIADKTGVHFTDKNLLPADPMKAGYTFDGWKLGDVEVTPDKTYGSLVANDTVMEITLVAQWTAKDYTVQYDTKGGNLISDKTGILFTDSGLLPTDPVKAGYTFAGWKMGNTDILPETTYSSLVADDTVMSIKLEAQWTAKEYTVKYDTKGADAIADKTGVHFADKNLLPVDPVKVGYTFDGWKLGDVEITPDTTYSSLVADDTVTEITLVAQWKAKEYTVRYDTQGAGTIADKTGVHFTDKDLLPTEPEKDGYLFDGWKLDGTETVVTANSTYDSLVADDTVMSITLKAQWKAKEFTATWKTKDGETAGSITGGTQTESGIAYTNKPSKEVTVEIASDKEEYVLVGWDYEYIPDGSTEKKTGFTDDYKSIEVLGDITFTAKFASTPFVQTAAVNGKITAVKGDTPADITDTTTNAAQVKFTKEDNINQNPGSVAIKIGADIHNHLDAIVLRDYKNNAYTFKASDPVTGEYEVGDKSPKTKVKVTFNKDEGTILLSNIDTSLYVEVRFVQDQTYKVEFFTEKNDPDSLVQTNEGLFSGYKVGAKPGRDPKKAGYTFGGWSLDGTDAPDQMYDSNKTIADANLAYYAIWTAKEYQVSYNLNGGTAKPEAVDKKVGFFDSDLLPKDTKYTKKGYTFAGWKHESTEISDATTYEALAADDTVMSITLTAQWKPISYQVLFDKQSKDAVGTMEAQQFRYDEEKALTSNGFTYSGYTFAGWAAKEGGDVIYAEGQAVKNLTSEDGKSVTLYAVWNVNGDIPYAVEHYKQKADGTWDKKADETEKLTGKTGAEVSAAPKAYEGYVYDRKVDGTKAAGTITGDGKLVLKLYYRMQVTVDFDSDGGNYTPDDEIVNIGEKVTYPKEPTKPGYKFEGWYVGDKKWDFDTKVTESMTLKAKWSKISTPANPSNPLKPGTPSSPSAKPAGTKVDSIKTGDETNLMLYGILCMAAIFALAEVLYIKKKRRNKH